MVQTSSIFFYDGAEKLLPHQPQAVSNTKWMIEPGQRQRNRLKPLFELIFFLIGYNTASGDWLRETALLQNAELMDQPASRPQRQNR